MENHIENKQDKGFTLVELLIVIVILGILATVTVFAVRGITSQGKTSTCKADAKTLQTGYEAFSAQYGVDIPVLPALPPTGAKAGYTANGATAQDTLVNAGFLHSVSKNWDLSATGVLSLTTLNPNQCVAADAL
jgi:prepilin-type N-terminal cleavage/methylation domain-containing protein